jgi:GMP synthase-like glutamine amidotransferase
MRVVITAPREKNEAETPAIVRFLLIRNTDTETPGLVGDYLRASGVACVDAHAQNAAGLPSADLFDGLAVFGSPASCTELTKYPQLLRVRELMGEFVRSEKPVLGVCFGGQLLAQALGAEVRRSRAPEIGVYTVRLTDAGRASPFFADFPESFPTAQWHNDTFDLPGGATLLATSESCQNQAFSRGRCLAVQFHPELTLQRGRDWAVEYADELTMAAKSADEIRQALDATYEQRAQLCRVLVERFIVATSSGPA